MVVFLMYNVMINEVGCDFGESPCNHPETADTEVAVTGEIHLLCLSQ